MKAACLKIKIECAYGLAGSRGPDAAVWQPYAALEVPVFIRKRVVVVKQMQVKARGTQKP